MLNKPRDDGNLIVIDAMLGCLLQISRIELLPTQGLSAPRPTLCGRHEHGMCRNGARCPRIHVQTTALRAIRSQLPTQFLPHCCVYHGDQPFDVPEDVLRVKISDDRVLEMNRMSYTDGLRAACATAVPSDDGTVDVKGTICAAHHSGLCPEGERCMDLHMCWDTAAVLNQPTSSVVASTVTTPSSAMSTVTVPTLAVPTVVALPSPSIVTPTTTGKSFTVVSKKELNINAQSFQPQSVKKDVNFRFMELHKYNAWPEELLAHSIVEYRRP